MVISLNNLYSVRTQRCSYSTNITIILQDSSSLQNGMANWVKTMGSWFGGEFLTFVEWGLGDSNKKKIIVYIVQGNCHPLMERRKQFFKYGKVCLYLVAYCQNYNVTNSPYKRHLSLCLTLEIVFTRWDKYLCRRNI